mgnify:FL=1
MTLFKIMAVAYKDLTWAQNEYSIATHPLCAAFVNIPDTVELERYLTDHLDLILRNIAVLVLIALIVAVHYAVKQGDKSSVKNLLDSITPEQQLKILSVKDEDGKRAVQLAPADLRKDMDKMLKHYKREAEFEVNYGKLAPFPH